MGREHLYLTDEERPFARELAIEATMRANGGKRWPPQEPTKPTKPGSVSFVSGQEGLQTKNSDQAWDRPRPN